MTSRGRAIAIIIGTLLIGVVIGALIVGPLVARYHFKRIADLRTPKGFAERLEEIIGPDQAQVEVLRPVLAKYGDIFDEVASRHRDEMKDMIDSLHAELGTILTDEQMQRLQQRHHRIGPPGEPGDRHGPPGEPGDRHRPPGPK
jgi:hypothetical protein